MVATHESPCVECGVLDFQRQPALFPRHFHCHPRRRPLIRVKRRRPPALGPNNHSEQQLACRIDKSSQLTRYFLRLQWNQQVKSFLLSFSALGAFALAAASLPAVDAKPIEVAQGSAEDLGVMSINLKDLVKPQVGVQGQTQAAGTPTKQVWVDYFLWLSARTASSLLMSWRMPTSLTSTTTPASSTPPLLAPPSPPHPVWATAGSMATVVGCMASMRATTPDQ